MDIAKKIALNTFTHSVRASQAVLQYGVGAMIDFPNQTLMTAAPEYWEEQVKKIHDERLEKLLHVDYFGLPLGQDDPHAREGISYVRFPEWYFCPKCRRFKPIKEWVKEFKQKAKSGQLDKDPDMVKYVQCPTCRQDLVVTRIVTACAHGHIDDFPWIKWVHSQNFSGAKPICERPALTFKTSASSTEGLEGLTVSCSACGAKATLKGAFDIGKFKSLDQKQETMYDFRCNGRHPWKNTTEKCVEYPKVLQRGSSSVYFPIIASSLVIPPYSSILTKKIENSLSFEKCREIITELKQNSDIPFSSIPKLIKNNIDKYTEKMALEIGVTINKIKPILERKWLIQSTGEEYSTASVKYRAEEYEALSGELALTSDAAGDFLRESTKIEDYSIPSIKRISLIHKLREVQALTGFSRLKPIEQLENNNSPMFGVSVKLPETNWYPAYEVRGEGLFIEFDESIISKWLYQNPNIQDRIDLLNENYKKSFIGSSRPRLITAKFLLIHTISHLLLKQLSFECGYNIASLKERIYCSEPADGKQMAGILIYTASGDSEGTLGGLVRQGRPDTFPGLFKKAIESAMSCSNDPVCSLSMGQGRDSLNLAACYSCSLIPETSCEEFNVFLDRSTVVGTFENRKIGFYHDYLFGGKSWANQVKKNETSQNMEEKKKEVFFINKGLDMREVSYKEIWDDLLVWAEEKNEIHLLKDLIQQHLKFAKKEKPHRGSVFFISDNDIQYKCDLYWHNSNVALFTLDNEDGYIAAKQTGISCFFTGDKSIDSNKILASIKER